MLIYAFVGRGHTSARPHICLMLTMAVIWECVSVVFIVFIFPLIFYEIFFHAQIMDYSSALNVLFCFSFCRQKAECTSHFVNKKNSYNFVHITVLLYYRTYDALQRGLAPYVTLQVTEGIQSTKTKAALIEL